MEIKIDLKSLNKQSKITVDSRLKYFNDQQKGIQQKKINSIPFHTLKSLNKFIPGIIPGVSYGITSHTGMSKTQFTKFTFVFKPIEFCIKHNIPFTCIYIALEESKEEFIDSLFIYILRTKYNLVIDRFKLNGIKSILLSDAEINLINQASKDVEQYMQYIHIIDDIYKPTKLFEEVKSIAEIYGKFEIHTDYKGNEFEVFTPTLYNHKFLVVTDHISLLEEEYDEDLKSVLNLHKTMSKWNTNYLMKIITKRWKFTSVVVHQQSLDSGKEQFTSKGDSVIGKVLPTIDGLADNKTISRDYYMILGLFSPERYGIENYRGYKIMNNVSATKKEPYLGDNFRTVHILKARFGIPNKVVPLYFDGSYNYFEELPIPDSSDPSKKALLDKYYKLSEDARKLQSSF